MVVREADVVCCSIVDLAVIGTDAMSVRRTMRSNATLVVDDGAGVTASGSFGAVRVRGLDGATAATTATICAELARPVKIAESESARWHRIVRRGTTGAARA